MVLPSIDTTMRPTELAVTVYVCRCWWRGPSKTFSRISTAIGSLFGETALTAFAGTAPALGTRGRRSARRHVQSGGRHVASLSLEIAFQMRVNAWQAVRLRI